MNQEVNITIVQISVITGKYGSHAFLYEIPNTLAEITDKSNDGNTHHKR